VEVTLAIKKDGKPMAVKLPAYKIVEPIKDGHFRIQWPNTSSWPGCPLELHAYGPGEGNGFRRIEF